MKRGDVVGKVILCQGKTANHPYVFKTTGVAVYTIEELCYYIFHNVASISEELYEPELVTFLREELGLKERADFIEDLIHKKAILKDIVVSIICSADYYDKAQINALLSEIDAFYRLSPVQRKKRQADFCMKHKQYKEAMREYRNILNSREFSQLSSEEYGNILHNIAVLEANTGAFLVASVKFLEAYERNGNTASLKQYLYSLKLSRQEGIFERELKYYVGTKELLKEVEDELYHISKTCEYTALYADVTRIKELKDQGRMKEYYLRVDELLEQLKKNYKEVSL